ncbi:MAG TPA: Rne/Rng family ribonuclease [Candidatus Angelobacter sp.]|nr:Rne/Rng family ribonuclease [Candidatus Angelobacter sp.]
MAKELFVSSTPHETKVAIVEDDQLAEIYYERENEYTLAGSIYKGRVTRVLPGMQSAFVNIGLERDAFLYVSDFLLEEDEDADAIGEVVTRSRNESPVIEVRSAEGHPSPIEAQEAFPPVEAGAEGDDEAGEPAEAAEGSGQQEPEREGARRWRGRRRRGRGGRDRFGDRGASDRGANDRGQSDRAAGDRGAGERADLGAQHEHAADERSVEAPSEDREEQQSETRPEPRAESRYDSRPERPRSDYQRREQRPERSDYQRPEPILLPGESISKYQPAGSQPASGTPSAAKTETGPRPKPSTEYSLDPSAFSAGSMVLPGENLAKYGKKSQPASPTATETAEPEVSRPETHEHGFRQDAESAGPIPREYDEPQAEARVEAPTVFHRREAAPEAPASIERPATRPFEEPTFDEGSAHVDRAKDEQRFENMNVASVFGGGAAEVDTQQHVVEEEAAEQHEEPIEQATRDHETHDHETQPAREEQVSAAHAPQVRGVVEEEEIEEEESDIPGFEEDMDLAEFEEMEEEVLGPAGDQMLPMGVELMEAVRDAKVNERATGKYEAEGLDPEEAEEVEGVFAMAEEEAEAEAEGEEAEEEVEEGASAEQRAPATAGYQQRTERRPQDRRGGRRGGGGRRPMRGRPRHQSSRTLPAISDLLKEGQEILVQIAKEPIAKKGARITSHIALPGRYLVYMPTVHHTGVSRKIASEEERHRLKRIALSERGESQGGFIVRTAAAGAEEQDLRNDIRFLINLWNEIKGRAETSKAPALIYHDLNLVERILRDQVSGSFSAIWADTEQEYERVLRFVSRFQPSLVKRVKLYSKDTPLFEQFNITDEINKALKSKVWLRSGGYIVINQTEALVAIDINTGKYVGKTARLEDTIVKTNIDAIKEIVRQIRLRDLGGIIVIDFIDMDERRNRAKVMQALEEALKADRAPSKVLQFNDFGLVAITRKRVKQSLERTLGQPCATCQATGMIKSVTTVCNEIYVEMRKMARHFERDVMVRVHPDVAKALKANNARWIQELEELTKRTVLVKSDPLLHPEQFDIQ